MNYDAMYSAGRELLKDAHKDLLSQPDFAKITWEDLAGETCCDAEHLHKFLGTSDGIALSGREWDNLTTYFGIDTEAWVERSGASANPIFLPTPLAGCGEMPRAMDQKIKNLLAILDEFYTTATKNSLTPVETT